MTPPSYTRLMRDACSQCHCEQRSEEAISFYSNACPERGRGKAISFDFCGCPSKNPRPLRARVSWPEVPSCLAPLLPVCSAQKRICGVLVPRISSFACSFPSPRGRGVRGEGVVDLLWTRITPASPISKNVPLLARVPHLPYLLMSSQLSFLCPGIVPHCFRFASITWSQARPHQPPEPRKPASCSL